jgi:ribonuclease-3
MEDERMEWGDPSTFTQEQIEKLEQAQAIVGHAFAQPGLLLSAITHPSAVEGKPVKFSYERLEFLGDSVLGAIVATEAFHRYPELDEGGLTRIKVALVAGSSLAKVAESLGFADIIVFGLSEAGTGRRGLHSALENVYEATIAALYLDAGIEVAQRFVAATLLDHMSLDMAKEPENPKSILQEKLQEDGITPTYKLVETQGPPHDRTFITQVYAGLQALARGVGRTKKESESQAAEKALRSIEAADAELKKTEKARRKAEKAQAKKAEREARRTQKD